MGTDDFFRARLDQMIDLRHPLAVLAQRMPWQRIEAALAPALAHKNRPGTRVDDADLFGASVQLVGAGAMFAHLTLDSAQPDVVAAPLSCVDAVHQGRGLRVCQSGAVGLAATAPGGGAPDAHGQHLAHVGQRVFAALRVDSQAHFTARRKAEVRRRCGTDREERLLCCCRNVDVLCAEVGGVLLLPVLICQLPRKRRLIMRWVRGLQVLLAATTFGIGTHAVAGNPPVDLVTLGTIAGPPPTVDRAQNSQVLIVDGNPYLVDAGENAVRRLKQADVDHLKVGTILITHPHGDHVHGLPSLLSTSWYYGRAEPIRIYGPPGTKETVDTAKAFVNVDAKIRVAMSR